MSGNEIQEHRHYEDGRSQGKIGLDRLTIEEYCMIRKLLWCGIIVVALMMLGGEVAAQEDGAVYAVLFYSPTCPHCHKVINEDLPPMQEEFGDSLQVLFINVQHPEGGQMLLDSCQPFGIPDQVCGSVPTLIMADDVMIGSDDIPARMPGLVRAGLEAGGIDLPAIPGLRELVDAANAQREQTEAAGVVNAIMFYSPVCPHCHKVINDDLPPMEEEFGDSLQILFVNVDEEVGAQLFLDACEPLAIDEEFCGSVPTVIVDDEVLIGSSEIPERMPDLVRAGIASGGIGLPEIPGIDVVFSEATAQNSSDVEVEGDGAEVAAGSSGVCSGAAQACIARVSWQDRYVDDLFGNGLATGVLIALIASIGVLSVGGGWAASSWLAERPGWILTTAIALLAAVVAGTLLLQIEDISIVSGISLAITAALVVAAGIIWDSGRYEDVEEADEPDDDEPWLPEWVFPLVALAGLAVAGYMAYVEIGGEDAVCGALGDCNLVQQSEYTELFGVIPVGGLGVVGYVMILAAWWLTRQDETPLATYLRPCRADGLLLLEAPQGWSARRSRRI